jgi:hypothetical protein
MTSPMTSPIGLLSRLDLFLTPCLARLPSSRAPRNPPCPVARPNCYLLRRLHRHPNGEMLHSINLLSRLFHGKCLGGVKATRTTPAAPIPNPNRGANDARLPAPPPTPTSTRRTTTRTCNNTYRPHLFLKEGRRSMQWAVYATPRTPTTP